MLDQMKLKKNRKETSYNQAWILFLKRSYFFSFQSPWFCFGFTMSSLDLQKKARMLMRSWMLNKLVQNQRKDSQSVLNWIESSLKLKIFWNSCLYQTITLFSTLLDTFTGEKRFLNRNWSWKINRYIAAY